MAQPAEPPKEIKDIFEANEIDLVNRIVACDETPLTNPDNIPLTITEYSFRPDQHIVVVRDDFLCGGTKSRAAYDFVRDHILKGERHFVYISPWYGGAQIALPWITQVLRKEFPQLNLESTIIIDAYPLTVVNEMPPYTRIGLSYGANFIQVPLDQDKFKFAREYSQKHNAIFLEPGFDYPQVISKIGSIAMHITKQYGHFDECWSAVGSGTLIRGLQDGNIAQNYHGVCIFKHCPDVGRAEGIIHDLGHNTPVNLKDAPPFRSALYYDAKVWKYVRNRPGKIILWNVM